MVFERENHFEFVGQRVGRRPWQQTWVLPRLPGWINWTFVGPGLASKEAVVIFQPIRQTVKVVFQVFAVTVANRGERVISIREQLKERELSF